MNDNQTLANDIGATLRAAERAAQAGNLGQTITDLARLHAKLGKAFLAFNVVANEAGREPLEWGAIAGNDDTGSAQRSGGGNKAEPTP